MNKEKHSINANGAKGVRAENVVRHTKSTAFLNTSPILETMPPVDKINDSLSKIFLLSVPCNLCIAIRPGDLKICLFRRLQRQEQEEKKVGNCNQWLQPTQGFCFC